MDLLGDIGTVDQLTSAREENKLLQEKCKELKARVQILTIENESLKAEIEMYRKEVAVPNFSSLALGGDDRNTITTAVDDDDTIFLKSGNGQHVVETDPVTINNLHDTSNILSCSMSSDEVYIATGGADGSVRITQWGAALNSIHKTDPHAVIRNNSCQIQCSSPVISTKFTSVLHNTVAAGCMDGTIQLVSYSTQRNDGSSSSSSTLQGAITNTLSNHKKYVRDIAWSPTHPLLATASADGTVIVYSISKDDSITTEIQMSTSMDDAMEDVTATTTSPRSGVVALSPYITKIVQSFHFPGPVECIAFTTDGTQLVCYARDTPYITTFDITKDFQLSKLNVNEGTVTGGFPDHVSYAIMDMKFAPSSVSSSSSLLACATDTSRNMIYDIRTNRIVRDMYGHQNDSYSQPKIAWSSNGQYIYGNTQNESVVCIWDISSTNIVSKLTGHTHIIRDLYSSPTTDTLVTTSFDKQTKLWFSASY